MAVINITNAVIQDITSEQGTTYVTITYTSRQPNQRNEQTLRLVVRPRTIILNANGFPIKANALREGMNVNVAVSSAYTRSIPPQTVAYLIRIAGRQRPDDITVGNILDVDRNNRSFTTISDRDFSSIIRFNVPENAMLFDRMGRPVNFSRLTPGMRVRVRHANFATASIPPQTTAFEVRML